ncbi:MAG: recombination protein RecR [Candidatus Competibacteraceae bacterium]|nr:recombination protein RecR [Candidatus Competibacteraceae bacterium]
MYSPVLQELLNSLRCLPGVGPKSAQRMALHLLERDRAGAERLAQALNNAVERIGHCQQCRLLSETELCRYCSDDSRDGSSLCIVETPADVFALEQATAYRGLFFVLTGHLSPLDGIGPEELGLDQLEQRLRSGHVQELILATSSTVEGEATAHYIAELAREYEVRATRIAHGVPLGGELEYIDGGTLSHAFSGRREMP